MELEWQSSCHFPFRKSDYLFQKWLIDIRASMKERLTEGKKVIRDDGVGRISLDAIGPGREAE